MELQASEMSYEEALELLDELDCDHDFVDARNEFVQSGEVCIKCGAVRA